jgi:hypothetical protein
MSNIKWTTQKARYGINHFAKFYNNGKETYVYIEAADSKAVFINLYTDEGYKRVSIYHGTLKAAKDNIIEIVNNI